MSEAALMRKIQLKASQLGWRLFRNNVGFYRKGLFGIRYGLGVGSSDLIGWRPYFCCCGRSLAQFTAVEVKVDTPLTKEQANFLKQVIKAGGIGIVARSVDDLTRALK